MSLRSYVFSISFCVTVAAVALWFAPRPRNRHYPMETIDRRLSLLAGFGAINCGRVGIWQDPNRASDCAIRSLADRQPFYVRFVLLGIDSVVAVGLAGDDDGEVFAVEYDSEGWSSEISEQSVLSDHNRIIIEPCPRPIALRKSLTGRLTCFLPNPDAGNLMSPALGPY